MPTTEEQDSRALLDAVYKAMAASEPRAAASVFRGWARPVLCSMGLLFRIGSHSRTTFYTVQSEAAEADGGCLVLTEAFSTASFSNLRLEAVQPPLRLRL